MKRILGFLVLISVALSLSAVSLRIFHTNDTHGAYLPQKVGSGDSTSYIGGYANLEYHLQKERSKAPRSIYVDAGDQQTGSVFASLKYKGAIGGAVIKAFNHLPLDATTFGNHEFDMGQENAINLTELALYPFVSTNLRTSFGTTLRSPYHIIKRDSLKIGILGLTMLDLSEKVKKENVAEITVESYSEAINRYLEELDAQTDLIILLTHIGFEADHALAFDLDDRIDLIIGGHSHDAISEPVQANGIYITSAGSHLQLLGLLDLEVENDRITSYKQTLIPLIQPELLPETKLSKFISVIADSLEVEMGKVIANIPKTWTPNKFAETELSLWAANALYADYREQYQPDLALINCGGLRKTIPAGPVTLRDMHELMPFNNNVVLFSCFGSDLLTMVEYNKQIAAEKPYDIVQGSDMGWKMQPCPGGHGHDKRVFTIHGQEIERSKLYRVVSHDYLVGQWEKYLGFEPLDVVETGDLILDSAIRQIKLQYGQ
ncbi:MAG: bifunctional metallophosphatase/5'-nucleotidase [Candidatus Cloacimonetes bacterium]|nr:bifunctional metallophosphatase/5'-nucleotidase [Candidatus Cloacimonadota bacterium]